jgi:hypothetical protein
MRRDESHIIKRVMTDESEMNVDGHPSRGRPRKRWMDYVLDDMRIEENERRKHVVPTPHSGIRGR